MAFVFFVIFVYFVILFPLSSLILSTLRGIMRTIWQDLRYRARMLLKNPGFTLIAVITLALGIGANTAIFSVVNGVLLSSLPYPHPEQLAMVWCNNKRQGIPDDITSYPNFVDWRDQNKTFQGMAGVTSDTYTLTAGCDPIEVHAADRKSVV